MTLQDAVTSVNADVSAVASATAQLTTDDAALAADLTAAGVTEFSIPSVDGLTDTIYTVVAGASPPFTVVTIPTAASITLGTSTTPAVVAPAVLKKCRR